MTLTGLPLAIATAFRYAPHAVQAGTGFEIITPSSRSQIARKYGRGPTKHRTRRRVQPSGAGESFLFFIGFPPPPWLHGL